MGVPVPALTAHLPLFRAHVLLDPKKVQVEVQVCHALTKVQLVPLGLQQTHTVLRSTYSKVNGVTLTDNPLDVAHVVRGKRPNGNHSAHVYLPLGRPSVGLT